MMNCFQILDSNSTRAATPRPALLDDPDEPLPELDMGVQLKLSYVDDGEVGRCRLTL